ncbi:MAG: L,D-transpeptidase [Gammaproteobacteria bacterium]
MRSIAFAIFSIICFLLLSPIALADDYYDDYSFSESPDYSYSDSYRDEFSAFPQDEAPVRKKHRKAKVSISASISPLGEKAIIVNPKTHSWGAYAANGKLVRSGTATSGAYRCPEDDSSCKTAVGRFRIYRMGDSDCYSTQYPVPDGGAPMPYCMYFNGGQAIHGSNAVYRQNASHGCVRVQPWDAEWLRYNFVAQGTLVVIKPY